MDGILAVLCWPSLLACAKKPVAQVVKAHWLRFGRSYFQRHDYETLDAPAAGKMIEKLVGALPSLAGRADDFHYTNPVDHSETPHAGIRILLADGSRMVCRLSGTGTDGATLRLYLERHDQTNIDGDPAAVLQPLVGIAQDLLGLRQEPALIT